jgi:hypothetical protein
MDFQPCASPASRPNRFGRGPMIETSEVTSSSRMASSGGFVTCAKFWWK